MSHTGSSKSTKQFTVAIDQAQTFEPTEQAKNFSDLVVNGSLSPVRVKVKSTKNRKKVSARTETLLTELQCEV